LIENNMESIDDEVYLTLTTINPKVSGRVSVHDTVEYVCCNENGEMSLGTVAYAHAGNVVTVCNVCENEDNWSGFPTRYSRTRK